MKISVVRPEELGASEMDRWRELQGGDPLLHNPFLAPGFTLAVGSARRSARVAVMEDGGRVAGFFPYERRGVIIGKPIGAGISDCQGVIHQDGLEWDAADLMRACRLPLWEFDHLLADQAPFQPYHTGQCGSLIMDLSGGFEAYLAERRKATRASITKAFQKRRKLERDAGPIRLAYDIPTTESAPMETLKRWKSQQYRETGHFDRFATPWVARVVDQLRHARDGDCRGVLSAVYAGDRIMAADFGLRGRNVLAGWFTAYDREFRKYAPGFVLTTLLAEAAAADGVRHLDMGKGESEFKERLCSWKLPLAEGRVVRSRLVAGTRSLDLTVRNRLSRLHRLPGPRSALSPRPPGGRPAPT